jgi:hypothetical protein
VHIQGLAEESGWHGEQLLQGVGRCKGQICGEGLCELANEQPASRICILDYSCPGIIWRSWLCRVTNILSVMDLELYISSCNALGSYSTNSTYHSCILIYCKGMLCPTCPYQPKCRCVYTCTTAEGERTGFSRRNCTHRCTQACGYIACVPLLNRN